MVETLREQTFFWAIDVSVVRQTPNGWVIVRRYLAQACFACG
jgi:hypothetical protein